MMFYTYVHCRPDTSIFYVGKGVGSRANILTKGRNKHHRNIVEKYGKENILVGKLGCSSEAIAFDLEKGLIKCLRRSGINIVNLTDGGEGCSGRVVSEDHRNKLSMALKGRTLSSATRSKMSYTRKGLKLSEETKRKMSKALKGKAKSEDHKLQLSISGKGRVVSEETRTKLSIAAIEQWKRKEKMGCKKSKGKKPPRK